MNISFNEGTASNRRSASRLISLTPLIDVVFILLVFFMLASSFLDWRTIELTSVSTQATTVVADGTTVAVEVLDDALLVSGVRVTSGELIRRVTTAVPQSGVILKPQRGVRVQRLIDVLDLLNNAGVARISVAPAKETS
ncbi:MAG: biopolymer transporter ExbD [Pseudomonadota bacterium]